MKTGDLERWPVDSKTYKEVHLQWLQQKRQTLATAALNKQRLLRVSQSQRSRPTKPGIFLSSHSSHFIICGETA